jgi:hypothetical protein
MFFYMVRAEKLDKLELASEVKSWLIGGWVS